MHDDPLLDGLLSLCTLHSKARQRGDVDHGPAATQATPERRIVATRSARAGLQGRVLVRKLDQIPAIAMPALLLLKDGRSAVLLGWQGDDQARLLLSESGRRREPGQSPSCWADDYSGKVFFAQPQHKFDVNHGTLIPRARSWFRDTLKRSRWLYADAIAASFLINIIAMAAPLFVMNVYDRVVPNQAEATLWVLALGITGAYIFDLILKSLRSLVPGPGGQENRPDHLGDAVRAHRRRMAIEVPPWRASGSFAQNIHEFQSLRDFLASRDPDQPDRPAVHAADLPGHRHSGRTPGVDSGAGVPDRPCDRLCVAEASLVATMERHHGAGRRATVEPDRNPCQGLMR